MGTHLPRLERLGPQAYIPMRRLEHPIAGIRHRHFIEVSEKSLDARVDRNRPVVCPLRVQIHEPVYLA